VGGRADAARSQKDDRGSAAPASTLANRLADAYKNFRGRSRATEATQVLRVSQWPLAAVSAA